MKIKTKERKVIPEEVREILMERQHEIRRKPTNS